MPVEKAETVLGIIRKQREDNQVKLLCQCGQFYILVFVVFLCQQIFYFLPNRTNLNLGLGSLLLRDEI